MRHACTVAAAAAVMVGFTSATVNAACDPNVTANCPAGSAQRAAAPLQRATAPLERATAPMQLNQFMTPRPARRAVRRSRARAPRTARVRLPRTAPMPAARPSRTAQRSNDAPPAAKAIATVSIPTPALALAPTDRNRAPDFGTTMEPWRGGETFAPADEEENLPPGVTIARFEEVNEIDLAASAQRPDGSDDLAGVSLVTHANAASSQKSAATTPSSADLARESAKESDKTSWFSWLYGQVVDGVRTVVLAIQSMFA